MQRLEKLSTEKPNKKQNQPRSVKLWAVNCTNVEEYSIGGAWGSVEDLEDMGYYPDDSG